MASLEISKLFFEHHHTPLGIAETEPRISWRFEGDIKDWEQSSYDLEICRGGASEKATELFSFNSTDSLYVPWPGEPLSETEAATVRVRSHGGRASTPWSDWVSVETGLLSEDGWSGAQPITQAYDVPLNEPKHPQYFRKEFELVESAHITSARLYITALGIYEAEINGKRVGDLVLAPGWQSYHHRHAYDTYDVTDLITPGGNAIGAVVGEGWYSGRLGFGGGTRNIYGDSIGLLALLVVTLEDGFQVKIPTDSTWKSSRGPISASEIYVGETYDARLEGDIEGWSSFGFEKAPSWLGTRALPSLRGVLVPPDQPGVRRTGERKPERIFKSPSGKLLVDFGQNLVGWLRIKVQGPSGTNITLRHAEVLEKGELGTRPLRTALARDTITLSAKPLEWEPKFTFHGFRYAQVEGWPAHVPLDEGNIRAVVVHTDMEQTGWFKCSNDLLNKFHSNVRWSMKGNFVSIPTDCPQRDERLGWTGDAHIFGPTSNYLYNTAGFWRSWHRDIWSEMSADGKMLVPAYVPTIPGWNPVSAVWADVAVGSPWNIYQAFGDRQLLEEHLPQAQGWIDVGVSRAPDGLWDRSHSQLGDWLDPLSPPNNAGRATTHSVLVADAYLVRMTDLLSKIGDAVGRDDIAEKYSRQHSDLRQKFQEAWVHNGKLANRTQTAYSLAIAFGLLTTELQEENATRTLREIISENDFKVGTGFAGTVPLGQALKKVNATEDFYAMLLQTEVPSWLYQVVMGGTTTWERWDSMYPDGRINAGDMTSFNHYAFGSVADWMHQVIGGIAPAKPGYKVATIAPIPGGGITHAEARFISPYGEIATRWTIDEEGFSLSVHIPPNARAEVTLPGSDEAVTVGSGHHEFRDEDYRTT